MRVVIARCAARYSGRLNAHLPLATRAIMLKADGSVLLHSDGGSYKPLNWMSPPCTTREVRPSAEQVDGGVIEVWTVQHDKTDDRLEIEIYEVLSDAQHDLGVDPGLIKDGVEAHLQELLAEHIALLGEGHTLVRREYMTAIGPVDILAKSPATGAVAVDLPRHGDMADADGVSGDASEPEARPVRHAAVEIKRKAGIDAVEQLTRYLEFLNRDPRLSPVRGVLAAQSFAPQARTLAHDRGIECLVLDYEAMKGAESGLSTLF